MPSELHRKIEFDLSQVKVPRQVSLVALDESPNGLLLRATPVHNSPGLLRFDLSPPKPGFDHEVRTAQDYAQFVAKTYGQQFLYVGDFLGRTVPVFDGVVLSHDFRGLYNVSLKYASVRMRKVEVEQLMDSMVGRLNYDFEVFGIVRPVDWFQKSINHGKLQGVLNNKNYPSFLLQSRLLMELFDLFPVNKSDGEWMPFTRELRTVVDVRDHGYPIEFFMQPEVQRPLIELVKSKMDQHLTLTLLWDANHVVEISPSGIQIHK